MNTKKNNLFLLERHPHLQEWAKPSYVGFLKKTLLKATSRLADKEDLILILFDNSVLKLKELIMTRKSENQSLKKKALKELTICMRESVRKNNLMTWIDNVNSYKNELQIQDLSTQLLKILARELILREKDSTLFWTDAYKDLSETLPLPIAIDCQDLHLNSLKTSLQKQEEQLQSLMITETNHQNKSYLKTYSQSYISTVVDKWVKDHMTVENDNQTIKTLTMKFHPTQEQKVMLDQNLRVSNYVYNKTIKYINSSTGLKFSKLDLRNKLVTTNSRKDFKVFNKVNTAKNKINKLIKDLVKTKKLKNIAKAILIKNKYGNFINTWFKYLKSIITPVFNMDLKDFEINCDKDIRAGAVFEAYTNYSNCIKAIYSGRINHFKLKYKTNSKKKWSMILTKQMLVLENNTLRFTNKSLNDKTLHFANRTRKLLRNIDTIKDSKITKVNGIYQLRLSVIVNHKITNINPEKVIGIDPGVSTFLSMYTPEKTVIIKQTNECKRIDLLRKKIIKLRKNKERKRIRRRLLNKLDNRKEHITNELHWKSINYLCKNYDVIFLEQFDTQGFVKNGKSRELNRNTNNLKPYKFRQRLLYKASTSGKIVEIVKSHHTTKTCSSCGNNQPMELSDRVYNCNKCNNVFDRDFNAAKNILLKGLLSC